MYHFLRHPQTTWNVENRMQGSQEGEILPEAKEITRQYIKTIPLTSVSHIYHANNKRTKFVADLLKKKYPEATVLVDERLNERNCGIFEGEKLDKIFSENDDVTNYRKRYYWKAPEGESHLEVSKRVKSFLREIQTKRSESHIICVTSSGVIRNLLRIINNLSLQEMYSLKIPNLNHLEIRL